MIDLNAVMQPDRPSVADIVQKFRKKDYFVDNSFQRKLVWSEKQKIRLIETILTNYPMPEIFLWQQPSDPKSGKQKFSIVDGQQRITSIVQFISNEFPLRVKSLDTVNKEAPFAGLLWEELSPDLKSKIWDYAINVRKIPSEVVESTIRNIFKRLNETDRSLNPQELRHAEFSGQFLKIAEELADLAFWEKHSVFSSNQVRRMGDIEFCSGLLHYLQAGITDDDTASMNEVYDLYNDKYEDGAKHAKRVKFLLGKIDKIFKADAGVAKLFGSVAHLYALFVVLDRTKNASVSTSALKKFAAEYSKKKSSSSAVERYRKNVTYRTKSKGTRLERVSALEEWLKPRKSKA